jgi:probable HAF family extracellular repeat protein
MLMKTNKNTNITRWLGLALACGIITFAVSSQAGKGGNPGKPPPPPPTPTGPVYQIVPLGSGSSASAINGAGWVAGSVYLSGLGSQPCVLVPEASATGPVYFRDTNPADGINDLVHLLPGLAGADDFWISDLNDSGIVAGTCDFWDIGTEWGQYRPTVWVEGMPLDLGYIHDDGSMVYCINNFGLVTTGPELFGIGIFTPSYVVVPKDSNNDGVPDTWFEDQDQDGFNDLLKLIALPLDYDSLFEANVNNFAPVILNDAGVIIVRTRHGPDLRLVPDFTDADGDGNPWFADANGDDFNDLMGALIPLSAEAPSNSAYAADINAAGQVVGTSVNRAVLWNFAADGTQTVTDLGQLSGREEGLYATAINDAGQIVGIATYRKSKSTFLVDHGTMYDLAECLTNGSGWANLQARDINNQGRIVGYGELNGAQQAFVAIPVAQP